MVRWTKRIKQKERDKARTETHAEKKNREEAEAKLQKAARHNAIQKVYDKYERYELYQLISELPEAKDGVPKLDVENSGYRLKWERSIDAMSKDKKYTKSVMIDRLIRASNLILWLIWISIRSRQVLVF